MTDINELIYEENKKNTEEAKKDAAANSMRKKEGRYENTVDLVGTIVKSTPSKSGKSTAITLRTRVAGSVVVNYPTVIFFADTAAAAAGFTQNQRVHIVGQITSFDPEKLKPDQSPVLLTGRSIELSTGDEVVSEEEGYHAVDELDHTDYNQFSICGQVIAIKNDKTDASITIRSTANGRVSIVEYPYLVRDKREFFQNIRVNAYVRAIGTVQTTNVVTNTVDLHDPDSPRYVPKTKKKQFYVLLDICSQ